MECAEYHSKENKEVPMLPRNTPDSHLLRDYYIPSTCPALCMYLGKQDIAPSLKELNCIFEDIRRKFFFIFVCEKFHSSCKRRLPGKNGIRPVNSREGNEYLKANHLASG